ncbi:AraC-like DNA-binding protein [Sphingobacterium allocomposti]|uniref:AraC-like DNA-binding protein n=2 Tax=Sphingobacterium allocomposti TaxID=415956 RepID=A0A5S5CVL0_9SPHI|nr:AraC-like DNA-binding protein [Sphingobacterium composti Yoo et al. 2007 non Ten et al. 2007]
MFGLVMPLRGHDHEGAQFNRRYLEVSVSLLATDIQAAHRVADSLRRVANTDEQKIKAHMLLANLYKNGGDLEQCMKNAAKADTIANTTMNYSWQASTSGFLATFFRQLGLLRASKHYLEKAEKANERQMDENMKLLTKINILHERVFHCVEEEDFIGARNFAQEAAANIRMSSKDDKKAVLIKATNDQLIGLCEFYLGDMEAAESFLNSSLDKIGAVESNLKPYIYRALADVAIKKREMPQALTYLKMVEPYLETGDVEELKLWTYETWSRYYEAMGDPARSVEYKSLAIDLREKRDSVVKELSDQLIEDFRTTKRIYRSRYTFAVGGILCVLFAASIGVIYFYNRQRRYKEKYGLIKARANNKPPETTLVMDTSVASTKTVDVAGVPNKEISMPKDTETRLYQQFLKQEAALFFLEKGVTLGQLATNMGTNARYVTHIIRKFRGRDFYDYIQTSRVEYIIEQLRNSPELLEFKLSYLADMCGFTSSSKFSTAFKQVTGMPPSAFVQFIKKAKEEDK